MTKSDFSTNSTNYALLAAAASFIIAVIMGAAVLLPKFQELKVVQKRIEEKKMEVQTREEYFSTLDEIKNKLKERQNEVSKIDSALPNDSSLPSLFNYLQEISSQSGLTLAKVNSFTISPSQNFQAIQETVFSVGIEGSYSSFKNFLSVLEKSARLIEIENISFSSPREASQEKEDFFTFDLKIKVYSY